jgi:hypothetical protein
MTLDEAKALVRRLGATEVTTPEDVVPGATSVGFRFVYAGKAYGEFMRVTGDDVARARAALPRALFVVACETIVPRLLDKRGAIALTEREIEIIRQGLGLLRETPSVPTDMYEETKALEARLKEIS